MTSRDPQLHLAHIREPIAAIVSYTAQGRDAFLSSNIAGMRDVVVHDYFEIDDEIVWNVVERELPRLREAIERLMGEVPAS